MSCPLSMPLKPQMLHCHHHHLLLFSNMPIIFPHSHNPSISLPLQSPTLLFHQRPTSNLHSTSTTPRAISELWLAQVAELTTAATEEGPVELPLSTPSIFATTDDPSPIQVATSLLLTGAVTVFLFRSLRRRAKRAKELKFRSSEAKKSLKEEALDSLKAIGSSPIEDKAPPSPVQALLGGISAGVIALILYKFTTTVEASLNRQTISDNFSVNEFTFNFSAQTVRFLLFSVPLKCYKCYFFVMPVESIFVFDRISNKLFIKSQV